MYLHFFDKKLQSEITEKHSCISQSFGGVKIEIKYSKCMTCSTHKEMSTESTIGAGNIKE